MTIHTIRYSILLAVLTWLPLALSARTSADSLQLKARIGYSIGGTAPLGVPATIRSIDAFRLTPSVMVGFDATVPLGGTWGLLAGLRFENKGMNADVSTKAYFMEVSKGESTLDGLFTGRVSQKVSQWMLTVPVEATLRLGSHVQLKAGPYISLLLSRNFSGVASDGYLRQGDPRGAKVLMGDREGEWATYDFSSDMRRLQFGVALGADFRIARHWGLSADLNWGLTGIFPSSFKTVEQTLYPIYGTIGLFYRF